jgi:hypothetical protein
MNSGLSSALPTVLGWGLLVAWALSGLPQALAQAPSPVDEKQLRELHIRLRNTEMPA